MSVDPSTTDMASRMNNVGPRHWTWAERDVRSAPVANDRDGGTLARFAAVVGHANGRRRPTARWTLRRKR
jgi:hypothetical protein